MRFDEVGKLLESMNYPLLSIYLVNILHEVFLKYFCAFTEGWGQLEESTVVLVGVVSIVRKPISLFSF
jgi:hypothetical protein